MNNRCLHHRPLVALFALLSILSHPLQTLASSWDPTLLVNTESFVEIDDGAGTDVYIQFGSNIAKQISYNNTQTAFTFSDDLLVTGAIAASDGLTINSDQVNDATLTFGNNVANQTIQLLENETLLRFSTGASFTGNLSGSSLTVSNLQNCDTLDTNASGEIICGTDANNSAVDLYVDETGDTMEGRLIVDIDTSTGNLLQPDDASLSANLALWLDASQIVGLNDGDGVSAWLDQSGNSRDAIQITPGNQPTYQVSEFGLQPVVRFDGIDDYLRDAAASYNARTVFIVQRASSVAQPNTDLAQLWGNYGDGVQVAIDPRASEGAWSFDGSGTATARCGTNTDSYGGTFANGLACEWLYDTIAVHAVEFTTDEALTATSIGTLFPAFTVGTHQYGGDIAEIIVYDRVLTDEERTGVENGLANKYELSFASNNGVVNTPSTVALQIESESTSGPAIRIDIQGDSNSPHLAFGSGGVIDTNLYRDVANSLVTDDSFTVLGTLSGAQINGFGLSNCIGVHQKITWNQSASQFECTNEASSTIFYAYDNTGGLTIDNTQQPIELTAQQFADSSFSHSTITNPSQVTINQTGTYRVLAQGCIQTVTGGGGQRGLPTLHIQRDTGGGFTNIPGALSIGYVREPTQNTGENLNIELFQTLNAGDSIRMTISDQEPGEPDSETQAECSRLLIQQIR